MRFGLLAYGPSGRLHRDAVVALLTVLAHRPTDSEIVVLTDRPDLYRWFGDTITVDPLTDAVLTGWRGPTGDRYRPKIEALRRLADGTADVALIDADTMARRDLTPFAERLAAGAVMLHRREYALAAPPRKGDRSLPREILGRTWQGITPPRDASMWNGGIVASSRRHHGIFDRTLAVFDEMRVASRHFAVEQLTYSIVFPAYGPIEEAAPWFDHYWANRPWFDRAAERFLSRALLEGQTPLDASQRLKHHPIVGELDARVPWWMTRLRGLVSAAECDDDDIS
jgi:hypothetical protein